MSAPTQTAMDYVARAEYWEREAARHRTDAAVLRSMGRLIHAEQAEGYANGADLRARSERRQWVDQTAQEAVAALRQLSGIEGEYQGKPSDRATDRLISRLEDALAYAMTKL